MEAILEFQSINKNFADDNIHKQSNTGVDPGFQVRGGAQFKNVWGISCEKSRFYAKKSYFSNFRGGGREIFGVFLVKNHDFTQKKSYFFQF